MTESTVIVQLDEPIKFRTIAAVEDQLLELLPESEFTPAQLARIAAVAREKHPDRRTQLVAILDAAAQEVAAHPPAEDTPALKALDQFRAEFDPKIFIEAGAPNPWLVEQRRPNWASRDRDQPSTIICNGGQWRSELVTVPMAMRYGHQLSDGSIELGRIECHLAQYPDEREPYVQAEPVCWVMGDDKPVRKHIHLRLDEAAAFARALLLLVDAAREAQ